MTSVTTITGKAFNYIQDRYKSDALNIALHIGLLTEDKLKSKDNASFTVARLALKGERSMIEGTQKFKLFDLKTKRVIFSLVLEPTSSMKVIEFKRGAWEGLFETYARENGTNKKVTTDEKPKLKLRRRVRKDQN